MHDIQRVSEVRPAVPQSFWFLALTLDTICAGRQQSNDLPAQLQQLKAEYINAVGAATTNALTLLLEDVIGSCWLPALRKGRCVTRARTVLV